MWIPSRLTSAPFTQTFDFSSRAMDSHTPTTGRATARAGMEKARAFRTVLTTLPSLPRADLGAPRGSYMCSGSRRQVYRRRIPSSHEHWVPPRPECPDGNPEEHGEDGTRGEHPALEEGTDEAEEYDRAESHYPGRKPASCERKVEDQP